MPATLVGFIIALIGVMVGFAVSLTPLSLGAALVLLLLLLPETGRRELEETAGS